MDKRELLLLHDNTSIIEMAAVHGCGMQNNLFPKIKIDPGKQKEIYGRTEIYQTRIIESKTKKVRMPYWQLMGQLQATSSDENGMY